MWWTGGNNGLGIWRTEFGPNLGMETPEGVGLIKPFLQHQLGLLLVCSDLMAQNMHKFTSMGHQMLSHFKPQKP